jgi:hypothetical protein
MIRVDEVFQECERRLHQGYLDLVENRHWLDFPMIVSIETYAKCNASCTFCPYVQLERVDTRLTVDRVARLIDEVAAFEVAPLRLNLSRVNEPLLDPNIFDCLRRASERLPNTQLILFTNGQAVTDTVIDRLNALPTFRQLTVSFNEYRPDLYREVMGLDQAKTLRRLDNLYARRQSGSVGFGFQLSRVGSSSVEDARFQDWCAQRFPGVPVSCNARFDWIGSGTAGTEAGLVPRAGCQQWFSLHVLADGSSAFCCIDGAGTAGATHIDNHSLLEIYNHPAKRRLRERAHVRLDVAGCASCIHGMPSAAFRVDESVGS